MIDLGINWDHVDYNKHIGHFFLESSNVVLCLGIAIFCSDHICPSSMVSGRIQGIITQHGEIFRITFAAYRTWWNVHNI
jgi:hypothetical protein